MLETLEVSLWPRKIPSRMQLSQIPHFQSRILFFNPVIESYANLRTPWKPINTILHQNSSYLLPESPDAFSLLTQTSSKTNLNAFSQNFCHLILLICFFFHLPHLRSWSIYIPAPVTEIYKLTSASLDSILILFLKLCFNEVGLILTNLVNLSLSGGIFPSSLKQALVQTQPSIHWWSQQLSTNFKPQLHFQNARKSRLLPTFDLTFPLTLSFAHRILLKLLFLKFTMTSTL